MNEKLNGKVTTKISKEKTIVRQKAIIKSTRKINLLSLDKKY